MLDDIDRTILGLVQDNARISNRDIAREVGLAPSATLERVRKLEREAVIQGWQAKLDPGQVGLGLLAFVLVRTDEPTSELCTGDKLAAIDEVQEVHHVAGEDCYLIKVRAAGTSELGLLLRERLGSIDTVTGTRTIIVLDTVKETGHLPLSEVSHDDD
ncbi:MAG: Lrp/AsnC family transcriptional regulator [Acidobacteriota bacterium]